MGITASIIVPCYNAEKTITLCLNSIISQTSISDEIILVDDASRDQFSQQIAGQVKIIKRKMNGGAAAARNEGAIVAQGEILIFIDADVELMGSEIETIKDYFRNNPGVNTLTGTLNPGFGPVDFFTDYKNSYMSYIFSKCRLDVNFVYGSVCAIRSSDYIPWPEEPRLGEDSHWGYLLSLAGLKIHLLKNISVRHLKQYSFLSLVKNDFKIAQNFSLLFMKYLRWKTLYTREPFGHTSKYQKLSLVLAVLLPCGLFISGKYGLFLIISWFLVNLPFFYWLSTKHSFGFILRSIFWTYFDHLVYSTGVLSGILHHMTRAK